MKMGWITIQVNNMEESIKFYTEILQLKINNRLKPSDDIELVFVGLDNVEIELMYRPRKKPIEIKTGVSIGLEIDSIDKWIEKLKSYNIIIDRKNITKMDDMSFFFIKDPSGLSIQLYEYNK